MKKSFYLLLAVLSIAACSKEIDKEDIIADPASTEMVEVSFKAVIDQEDFTKAEISMTDGSCTWDSGDEIAVHTTNGALAVLTAQSAGAEVTFKGSIPVGDAIPADAIAYYPASVAVEGEDDQVSLPLSYSSVSEAAKGFPMRGVLSAGTITFKHIGALLKVSVNDIPSNVNSVELSTSVAIAGTLDVDASDASAPICEIGTGAKTISIATSAALRVDPTTVFLIPLPVGELTGGFTINFKENSTVVATKSTASNVAIGRGKVVKMKAFAPEGPVSEWYIPGGFNSWSTSATRMTEVLGHSPWLVARNINTTPVGGQSAGFKFFNSGTWKGGSMTSLHTQAEANSEANIIPSNGSYDIYYNPDSNKFFLANAGEPWIYKIVHLMCDMELSDATYYLHIWPHAGSGLNTVWPGIAGSAETISGIPYHKFEVAICDGDFTTNTYDCIFHTSDDAIRYDFRDAVLTPNNTNSNYYLSFTGKEYNTGVDGTTYGEGKTNPMTQFSDPAHPEGESYWGAFVGGSLTKMHWNNGPELVLTNYHLTADTELKLNFNYKWIFFGPSTATVESDTDFSVSRSNTGVFKVSDLDDEYLCDIYLNVFEKTARIEAKAKANADITLYFGVPNPGTYVKYYTFNGKSMEWPGVEITSNHDTFNDVNYYKATVKGSEFWDSNINLIVVSDGITYSQTNDFTTADWSGFLDEYYFLVVGRDIVQQTRAEARWTFKSAFTGVNWSSVAWLGSNTPSYIADWKMTSDATNLYVLFKIPASAVATDRYIYSGYDTDNGASGTNAGGNVNGNYNAMSLIYPFRTTPGSVSSDASDRIACPVGTKVGAPEVHGVIRTDYAWVEMAIPRDKIGNPASASTVTVNHSYNWYVAGDKNITLY